MKWKDQTFSFAATAYFHDADAAPARPPRPVRRRHGVERGGWAPSSTTCAVDGGAATRSRPRSGNTWTWLLVSSTTAPKATDPAWTPHQW